MEKGKKEEEVEVEVDYDGKECCWGDDDKECNVCLFWIKQFITLPHFNMNKQNLC